MIAALFQAVFYQPILNILIFFYNIIPGHDLGVAIILITILLKLITFPLNNKALKSQKQLSSLQPKINEIKGRYKNDNAAASQEIMKLYREEKINPVSSCFPLLIQLPFLIAVYQVFRIGLTGNSWAGSLYPFIHNPGALNTLAFGFFELSKTSWVLALLAASAAFWQAKMMPVPQTAKVPGSKDEDIATIMNKQMLYIMPAMTFFVGISLPAGLSLYWLVMTLLQALQQKMIFNQNRLAIK